MNSHCETIKVALIRAGQKAELPDCSKPHATWAMQVGLTEPGIRATIRTAAWLKELGWDECRLVGASPLIRAQQSAFYVLAELGVSPENFANHIYIDTGFWSFHRDVWYLDCPTGGYNNQAVFDLHPEEVELEGQTILQAVDRLVVAAMIAKQSHVIAVSHGGPMDAAIMLAKGYDLKQCTMSDLGPGQGAILVYQNGKLVAVDYFQ